MVVLIGLVRPMRSMVLIWWWKEKTSPLVEGALGVNARAWSI